LTHGNEYCSGLLIFRRKSCHSPKSRSGPAISRSASGIHPILYGDTFAGPDMPNLTYIIPFNSLGDRERAWDSFGADPEWLKVREESIARGGQIVDYQNLSIWRAAPFSPIQ